MNYYPVFLNLTNKKCIVIGGGAVAERKVKQLLRAGASITVVSPQSTAGIKRLASKKKIVLKPRHYQARDVEKAFLVIAATSDEKVNKTISRESSGLVNVVDMPEHCTFIMPSVVTRGPLTIAISTSGVSPALSRTIREEIAAFIPEELSLYLSYLKKLRQKVLTFLPGSDRRTARKRSLLLKKLGSREMLKVVREKGMKAAGSHIDSILKKELPRPISSK